MGDMRKRQIFATAAAGFFVLSATSCAASVDTDESIDPVRSPTELLAELDDARAFAEECRKMIDKPPRCAP